MSSLDWEIRYRREKAQELEQRKFDEVLHRLDRIERYRLNLQSLVEAGKSAAINAKEKDPSLPFNHEIRLAIPRKGLFSGLLFSELKDGGHFAAGWLIRGGHLYGGGSSSGGRSSLVLTEEGDIYSISPYMGKYKSIKGASWITKEDLPIGVVDFPELPPKSDVDHRENGLSQTLKDFAKFVVENGLSLTEQTPPDELNP